MAWDHEVVSSILTIQTIFECSSTERASPKGDRDAGSSPVAWTIFGSVAELDKALVLKTSER